MARSQNPVTVSLFTEAESPAGGYRAGIGIGKRAIPHECLISRPSLIPRRVKRFAASVVLKETSTIGQPGAQAPLEVHPLSSSPLQSRLISDITAAAASEAARVDKGTRPRWPVYGHLLGESAG